MVKFADNPRLDAYIKSKGMRLPDDWNKYVRPGKKQVQCLFCPNDHDHIEIFLYPEPAPSTRGAISTNTYACENCFVHVRKMESEREVDRPDLFPKKESEWKMELFVEHALFAPAVHMHYMHLEKLVEFNRAPVPPSLWHRCYFCNGLWDSGAKTLKVPMGGDDVITGGKIKVCPSCWDLIRLSVTEISIVEHYAKHNIVECECPSCSELFPVYATEMDDQSVTSTVGYHQCPSCALNSIIDTNSVIFKKYSETYSETGLPNRFIYASCEFCDNDVDIDLTIIPNHLESQHVSFDDRIMCSDCAQGTAGPIGVLRLSPYVWSIYPTGVSRVFRVIIRHSNGRVMLSKIIRGSAPDIIVNYEDQIKSLPAKQFTIF